MNLFPGWLKVTAGLAVAVVLAGGAWFYRGQERQLRREVEDALNAIAHLKADQITDWRLEELGHGRDLSGSLLLPEGLTDALADAQSEPAKAILRRFRGLQNHCLFHDILLVDARGKVWLSLSGRLDALGGEDLTALTNALRSRDAVFSELHTDPIDPSPHINTIAPLFAREGEDREPVGAAVLVCDAREFLFPLVRSWQTPNQTAETLLVRRQGDEVIVLNELRHATDSGLKPRFPLSQTNLPCVMAALGREGIVEAKDHRGVPVVAGLQQIQDSPWALVVKMDTAEAFAAWRTRAVWILGLLFAALAYVGAALIVVWQRNEKAHFRKLYEAEAARLAIEERSGAILKSIGDAVIATNAQGQVELLNPVAEALTGWRTGEARGKPLEEVFRIINEETRQPVETPVRQVMREGLVVGLANHTLLIARDGVERAIADSGAPIRDDQGRIQGVVLVFRDQTEERRLHRALAQSEERLAEAQHIGQIGSWHRDLITGEVWWSAEMYRIFGVSPREFVPSHDRLLEFVHPDDRERVALHLEAKIVSGENYELEYRLCLSDGTQRTVAAIGHVERDPDGRPVRTQGVTQDITVRKRVEETLKNAQERLQALFSSITDALFVHGLNPDCAGGRFIEVNDVACRRLGYTRAELLSMSPRDIDAPDSGADLAPITARVLAGETVTFEQIHVAKDGTRIPVEISSRMVTLEESRAVFSLVRDITERQRADVALRESEERYRVLVEESPDAIGIHQNDKLVFVNSTAVRQLGARTKEQLLGMKSTQMIHPGDRPAALDRIRRRLAGETGVYPAEVRYMRLDGTIIPVEVSATSILFRGKPAVQFIARDRTERNRAEAQLRKLSRAVEQSPASVVITDATGKIEYVNPKFIQVTGYSSEEVIGQTPRILKSGEHSPEFYQQLWRTILAGREWHGEIRNRKKNGELYWEAAAISPILDAAGKVTHFLAVKEDTTERKQAEQAVQHSRQQLAFAIEGSGVGLWDWALPGGETLFNERACEMLGYTLEELSPMSQARWETLCHADDLKKSRERLQEHFAGKTPFFECEERLRHKDGHWVWVLDRGRVTARDAQGQPARMTGTHLDITERKQAEARIAEQAALLDAANDAIYVTALDHTVTYWNNGAERLYGWSRAEALGLKITEMGDLDPVAFAKAHGDLLAQGNWSGELRRTSKKGREQFMFCRWTLLRDEHGQPREIFAINTDVTEKKQLEAQFLRAQRMEGIGALAGGIAHDLNNILAPILMTAPLLRETVTDADGRTMLDTLEGCAQRGADIIKQLLTFARGRPGARAPLPARHLLREMEKIIRETFPRNIQPCVRAPDDLWPILGDATQIHQALMNLCVNARDAMPDGGKLTLATENLRLDEASAAMLPEAKAGDYVCLKVTDSGTGIAPGNLERIFDPFFTTKEIGKGTGLGLATVLGIVRGHGGFVRVHSRVGQGTTFELYFPASAEAKAIHPVEPALAPRRGQGELILVVDDESSVRATLLRILEKHGYQVVAAPEGGEALALFTRHRAQIRAVLTDLMMPGMDGLALVRALRQLEPRLTILAMTGLAERQSVKGLENLELSALLTKPFAATVMLTALGEALDAPRGPAK